MHIFKAMKITFLRYCHTFHNKATSTTFLHGQGVKECEGRHLTYVSVSHTLPTFGFDMVVDRASAKHTHPRLSWNILIIMRWLIFYLPVKILMLLTTTNVRETCMLNYFLTLISASTSISCTVPYLPHSPKSKMHRIHRKYQYKPSDI